MNLKPLGDRLIVRAVEEDDVSASGIVLPDTAKDKPQRGKVLAVGDGKIGSVNGPVDVVEGDEVTYSRYGGTEIVLDGEDLLVLREVDVLQKVTGVAELEGRPESMPSLPPRRAQRALALANARENLPALTRQADSGIARLRRVAGRQ